MKQGVDVCMLQLENARAPTAVTHVLAQTLISAQSICLSISGLFIHFEHYNYMVRGLGSNFMLLPFLFMDSRYLFTDSNTYNWYQSPRSKVCLGAD